MKHLFPRRGSSRVWLRFIFDCRASSLIGSAKVLTNKTVYVIRHTLCRFDVLRMDAKKDWLNFPFAMRGSVKWSPELKAWYVLEDAGTPGAMSKNREEPEAWILDCVSQGMTVIDIGAHHGRYVIDFSRRVGEIGFVVAVEPVTRNLEVLAQNIKLNAIHNVRVIRGACWSCREPLRLVRGNTLDVAQVLGGAPEGEALVGLPLDDLVEELALKRVDHVKIDVEGAELDVLEGSRKTLAQFRPRLFVECHRTLTDVAAWLKGQGYAVRRYQNDPHHGEGFGWVWALPDEIVAA